MGILTYHLSEGSATAVGFLTALYSLPFLLGGTIPGSLGDRFDRRKVIMVVQVFQFVMATVLCLLYGAGMMEIWHLYTVAFFLGASESVGFPVQQAFVGDLVPRSILPESIGMYSLVFNTCRAVGPPLAGVVLANWGATMSFGLNALSFIPLIFCLAILRGRYQPVHIAPKPQKTEGGGRISGLSAVLGNRFLLLIIVNALIQNCFGQALYQIVPAIARGDEHATGIILGAIGFGAVISILFFQPFLRMIGRVGLKLTGGVLWMGAAILVAGLVPTLHIQAACFFLAGLATSFLFITASSSVQLLAPPERKASVLGLYTIVSVGIQPLAGLAWGSLMDVIGVSEVLVIVGGVEVLLAAAILFGLPYWRNWRMELPEDGEAG